MYATPLILTVLCAVAFLPDQFQAVKLQRDWKTLSLKDIDANTLLSSDAGMPYYRIINKIDGNVYIGANETLLKLSVSGNSVTQEQRTLVTDEPPAIVSCAVKNPGTNETVCWNFIRVVEETNSGQLFVCGTNSYSGMCYLCPPEFSEKCDVLKLNSTKPLSVVPEAPTTNPATAIFDRLGNQNVLYSTSSAEEVFERYSVPDDIGQLFKFELGTVTTKKRLLDKPVFVGKPFEYMDSNGRKYIFIFYREIAMEYSSFGNRVYPRIARVCQNDTGGIVNVDKFVTYIKARLNCSIPDSLMPFYYDEIQDVVWDSAEEEVYAIFTSQASGPKSSAMCRYKMSDIMKLFDEGDFKDQDGGEAHNEWLPVTPTPSPRPGTCDGVHTTTYPPLLDKLVPNFNPLEPTAGYQVSPPSNLPNSDSPTLYVNGVRFTSMAMDTADKVFFFGTSDGTVIKHFNGSTVEINELGTTGAITGLEILEDNSVKYLVITTDNNVITWALNRECSARSQQECVIVRAPYCKWNYNDSVCNCLSSNCENKDASVLVQPKDDNITSCGNADVFLICEADAGPYFDGTYNLTWFKAGDQTFITNNSHLVEVNNLSDRMIELKVAVHKLTEGNYTCQATLDDNTYTKNVDIIWTPCLTQKSLDNRCTEYEDLKAAHPQNNNEYLCSVDVEDCSQCRHGYDNIPSN